jgi:hypothetical protein
MRFVLFWEYSLMFFRPVQDSGDTYATIPKAHLKVLLEDTDYISPPILQGVVAIFLLPQNQIMKILKYPKMN